MLVVGEGDPVRHDVKFSPNLMYDVKISKMWLDPFNERDDVFS